MSGRRTARDDRNRVAGHGARHPAGGVGANTALRDAAGLLDALIDIAAGKPVERRLADYESAMRDHGFAAVRFSAANGVRVIGQNPLPTA